MRVKKSAKVLLVLFLAAFLFVGVAVYAQGDLNFGLQPVQNSIGLASTDIRIIIARIIRAVLGLLGVIAVVIMIYAGYTIMTAGGDEEKVVYGKKIMINGVIGLIIILSSLAIVQYVLNALGQATGMFGSDSTSKPKIETFAGSGALGKIIKDHYPEKDQIGVKRNTKISVTFAEPIDPATIISNDNNTCWGPAGLPVICDDISKTPYYGDCITNKPSFDWSKDCDHLLTKNVEIFASGLAEKKLTEAAAMTVYEDGDAKNAYTFVFKPFEPIGDSLQDMWYTVNLNADIMKKDGKTGAFDGQHYKYYTWNFKTDTTFDFDPPFIKSTYPMLGDKIPRNTIIQINFSEAMDPIMTQGLLKKDGDFTNMIFGSTAVSGEWMLSNGYATAEFTPNEECGENSCGDTMYCLQIDCEFTDKNCKQDLAVLNRTGSLIDKKTFEANPFSGLMDMSGNALDGNKDSIPNGQPNNGIKGVDGDLHLIGEPEKAPDNYWWNFTVKNEIDRKPPYVNKVTPGLDAGGVSKNAFTQITFSRPMWIGTLDSIGLEEFPEANVDGKWIDFWFFRRSETKDNKTYTELKHREYGANGVDYFYFPKISSAVKSLNQNCLYPGYGPMMQKAGESPECLITEYNDDGVPTKVPVDCVQVTTDSKTDTGCIQTTDKTVKILQPDVPKCVDYLKDISK
ncbi:MAG: hypothetical protein HZC26_03280 [Candidatus Magasanikbacteria bacterium]|nr:hypothetical protein [Candidatus Magasanikbacteria bacterium]